MPVNFKFILHVNTIDSLKLYMMLSVYTYTYIQKFLTLQLIEYLLLNSKKVNHDLWISRALSTSLSK